MLHGLGLFKYFSTFNMRLCLHFGKLEMFGPDGKLCNRYNSPGLWTSVGHEMSLPLWNLHPLQDSLTYVFIQSFITGKRYWEPNNTVCGDRAPNASRESHLGIKGEEYLLASALPCSSSRQPGTGLSFWSACARGGGPLNFLPQHQHGRARVRARGMWMGAPLESLTDGVAGYLNSQHRTSW